MRRSMMALALVAGCSSGDDGRGSGTENLTSTPTSTPQTSGTETGTPTTGAEGTTGATEAATGSTTGTSTTVATTEGVSDEGGPPKLDVGMDTDAPGCTPEDTCCQEEGFVPPHALLDAFLAAYPAASMPKTYPELLEFEPIADGHTMAFSDENVGNELIDPDAGGVTESNIEAGRAVSRMAAEMAVPAGATVLEVREDAVVVEDLGDGGNGKEGCIGVGWGWGSIIFTAADQSIGELVYLYVGYCHDGDAEAFYFSEQSVELCPPPG